MARGKSKSYFIRLLVLAVLVGLVFLWLAAFRSGPEPSIELRSDLPGIGRLTRIYISLSEPVRGLSGYRVELVQGERVELLQEGAHTALQPWQFWGPRVPEEQLRVEVGRDTIKGLEEGQATIRVSASRAAAWLRKPAPVVEELTLDVKLRPPALQVTSTQTFVRQGGCEAVLYRVDDSSIADGVQVGEHWFPGYPLPGGDGLDRFALFGVPFDMEDVAKIELVARDVVQNEARARFVDDFKTRPYRTDTIRVNDRFLQRVVPAVMSQLPQLEDKGDLVANYLQLNRDIRTQNARTLTEMAQSSEPRFLWDQTFMQMRNAQVMSDFADRRIYVYNGAEIDRQDHLGFDLASTRQAEIQAANSGIVVLARYFGIYGNAVVVDHGHGLMSLYGHLSSISVAQGDRVERGQVLGRSGQTGLAGGDHLHFTMLLHGVSVNPREWWDGHWIHDRLELKLGDALPFRK
ncbi:MAG: M23 family metallopeptidase [bacterium]|nr:M23 family metallopeptidase [bacterium]